MPGRRGIGRLDIIIGLPGDTLESVNRTLEFITEHGLENHTRYNILTVTTESALQYKVMVEGDGPLPASTDKVKVHYRGTLIDGNEFDSSYSRGEPVTFQLDSVIPGWVEALQLMKVGSKYQLFIPQTLAYGEREVGPDIGPYSTLVFEVELIGIE